jgi:hypothetical protein
VIEVHEQHRHGIAVRERRIQPIGEQRPVGEPGQRITAGGAADARLIAPQPAREPPDQSAGGEQRDHGQQPLCEQLHRRSAEERERTAVRDTHPGRLDRDLTRVEEADRVQRRPQVVERVHAVGVAGGHHGDADHQGVRRDRQPDQPQRLAGHEQAHSEAASDQCAVRDRPLVRARGMRERQPQERQRRRHGVQRRERRREDRDVRRQVALGVPEAGGQCGSRRHVR